MSLLYAIIMFRVGIRSGLRMSRSGPHHHIYIRYRTRTRATFLPTASPGRKRKKIEERQRGDPSVGLFLVSSERASMTAGDPEKRLQNVMDKLYRAPKRKPSLPRSLPPETLEKISQFFFLMFIEILVSWSWSGFCLWCGGGGSQWEESGIGLDREFREGNEGSGRGGSLDGDPRAGPAMPAVGSRGSHEEIGYVQGHDVVRKAQGLDFLFFFFSSRWN